MADKNSTFTEAAYYYRAGWRYRRLKPATQTEYRRLLRKVLEPRFGKRLIGSLSRPHIAAWHADMAQATPTQANRALAVLSAVLGFAVEEGWLDVNPANGVRHVHEHPRKRYYTGDEIKKLLLALDSPKVTPEEASFILVLLYTGARPGELKSARWEYLNGDVLELPDSKVGARDIYLPHAALVALSPVHDGGDNQRGFIFPNVQPGPLWKRIRRMSGLRDARLYDLRHTFASVGLSAGLSLEAISQLLGHNDPRTTRRYAHLQRDTGRQAVGAIEKAMIK